MRPFILSLVVSSLLAGPAIAGEPVQDKFDVAGVNCTGVYFQLDNFAATKNPNLSKEGNYWYAYSDTSAEMTAVDDSARGASRFVIPDGKNKWTPSSGAAVLTATLEKNVTESKFTYHPYAGWAGIGIGFGVPWHKYVDFSPMRAVEFDLFIGAGTMAPGASWDTAKIPSIQFKVATNETPYSISIPVTQSGSRICVDLDSMSQPQWHNLRNLGNAIGTPIRLDGLMNMAWEMKILDQSHSSIHTSGPNTMAIANVKLYGIDSAYVEEHRCCTETWDMGLDQRMIKVGYSNGLKFGPEVGSHAQVDILRLNGTLVRSFIASRASEERLGLGTYLIRIREVGQQPALGRLVVVR